jgi:hypothetical protein
MIIFIALITVTLALPHGGGDEKQCNVKEPYDTETCKCWDSRIVMILTKYNKLKIVKGVKECKRIYGNKQNIEIIKKRFKSSARGLKKLLVDYHALVNDKKCLELNKIKCRIGAMKECIMRFNKKVDGDVGVDEEMKRCIKQVADKSGKWVDDNFQKPCAVQTGPGDPVDLPHCGEDEKYCTDKEPYDTETCKCWDSRIVKILTKYDELKIVEGVKECERIHGNKQNIEIIERRFESSAHGLKKLLDDYHSLVDDEKCLELNKIKCRIGAMKECIKDFAKKVNGDVDVDDEMKQCINQVADESGKWVDKNFKKSCAVQTGPLSYVPGNIFSFKSLT